MVSIADEAAGVFTGRLGGSELRKISGCVGVALSSDFISALLNPSQRHLKALCAIWRKPTEPPGQIRGQHGQE